MRTCPSRSCSRPKGSQRNPRRRHRISPSTAARLPISGSAPTCRRASRSSTLADPTGARSPSSTGGGCWRPRRDATPCRRCGWNKQRWKRRARQRPSKPATFRVRAAWWSACACRNGPCGWARPSTRQSSGCLSGRFATTSSPCRCSISMAPRWCRPKPVRARARCPFKPVPGRSTCLWRGQP